VLACGGSNAWVEARVLLCVLCVLIVFSLCFVRGGDEQTRETTTSAWLPTKMVCLDPSPLLLSALSLRAALVWRKRHVHKVEQDDDSSALRTSCRHLTQAPPTKASVTFRSVCARLSRSCSRVRMCACMCEREACGHACPCLPHGPLTLYRRVETKMGAFLGGGVKYRRAERERARAPRPALAHRVSRRGAQGQEASGHRVSRRCRRRGHTRV
jgi:hypothetical protein